MTASPKTEPVPGAAPEPLLAHDYLLVLRGAERTFAAMADEWPASPIDTLLYDERGTRGRFAGRSITTSPLQRLGVKQSQFRKLLPLFPAAVGRLPVGDRQLIVSSSSAFAHGVGRTSNAVHVCYCHSPFRYIWHESARLGTESPGPLRPAVPAMIAALKRWDLRAAAGVDAFVANSRITQQRIEEFWGRESTIVHPPVDVERFDVGKPEGDALIVCELVRHKRVDTALEAARAAGRHVRVVGSGPDHERLAQLYGDVATFLGRIEDAELTREYARASLLIVPNVEEFGIAAVEAQASGCPVLALDAGGTAETVVPGLSGVLVAPGEQAALAAALRETDWDGFDRPAIKAHAAQFSVASFRRKLRAAVDDGWGAARA